MDQFAKRRRNRSSKSLTPDSSASAVIAENLPKLRSRTRGASALRFLDEKSISESGPIDGENPLAWKVLNESQIESLRPLTPPEIEMMMAEIIGLQGYTVSLVQGSILDYYVGGFLFGIEQKFDNYQISCLLGVLQRVIENCQKNMALEANIKNFSSYFTGIKKWGVTHASGMEKFSIEQSKKVIDFMYQGIFQHYKLYENIFSERKEEEIIQQQVEVQLLPCAAMPFPAPLHEGLPLDLYDKYIAPQEPSETQSVHRELTPEDMKEPSTTELHKDPSSKHSEKEAVADMILRNLKPEEIKQIVSEMTDDALGVIKSETETKIKEREAVIVSKLNRLHLT